MGIRVEHQPGAIAGLAAYASGYGKAKERRRKDTIELLQDEQRRRDRYMMQQRGFMFQNKLQHQQRGWAVEDRELMREQELEDMQQERQWEVEDAYESHQYDLERDEARSAGAFDYATQLDEMKRQRDREEEMRGLWEEGELEFGPNSTSPSELNRLQSWRESVARSQLSPEEKEKIFGDIDRNMNQIISSGKPKKAPSLDDSYKAKVKIVDGEKLTENPDGSWRKISDAPDPDAKWREQQDRLYGMATKIMGEKDPSDPLGEKARFGDFDSAFAEAQRREWAMREKTGNAPKLFDDDAQAYRDYKERAGAQQEGPGSQLTPRQTEAVEAARAGDKKAQAILDQRGIEWRQ